jgi:hypothetical protein
MLQALLKLSNKNLIYQRWGGFGNDCHQSLIRFAEAIRASFGARRTDRLARWVVDQSLVGNSALLTASRRLGPVSRSRGRGLNGLTRPIKQPPARGIYLKEIDIQR